MVLSESHSVAASCTAELSPQQPTRAAIEKSYTMGNGRMLFGQNAAAGCSAAMPLVQRDMTRYHSLSMPIAPSCTAPGMSPDVGHSVRPGPHQSKHTEQLHQLLSPEVGLAPNGVQDESCSILRRP